MTFRFDDLEHLAREPFDFTPAEVLGAQAQQYQTASREEILDLLESTQEVYSALRTALPQALRQSSEAEIKFFASLEQPQRAQMR